MNARHRLPVVIRIPTISGLVLVSALLADPAARAGTQNHAVVESELSCADPVRARDFLDTAANAGDYFLLGPAVGPGTRFRCGCQATRGGRPERVKLAFEPSIIDADGNVIPLARITGRTSGRNGWFAAAIEAASTLVPSAIVNQVSFSGKRRIDAVDCYCAAGESRPDCTPGATTACLDGDRFAVQAYFTDPFDGSRRDLTVSSSGRDRVDLSFAPFTAPDLALRIIENCADARFGHYWVFASATTDIEFEVTVTDTLTGVARSYRNPDGQTFGEILDTRAFATCP